MPLLCSHINLSLYMNGSTINAHTACITFMSCRLKHYVTQIFLHTSQSYSTQPLFMYSLKGSFRRLLNSFRYIYIFFFFPSDDWTLWDVKLQPCSVVENITVWCRKWSISKARYCSSPVQAGQPHVSCFLGAAAHGYVLTD